MPRSPTTSRPSDGGRWRAVWIAVIAATACVSLVAAALFWLRGSSERRLNLLLVTIDTLRADRVGAYGDREARTPTLDGLASRGVRFDRAHTAVPLTGPSHATIFTGQYPPVHGVRGNVTFTLGARHPSMATLLSRQGYRTGAFVGGYPVAAAFGFGQGFDHYDEHFHEAAAGEQGGERPANEVANAAISWIRRQRGPFFAWVHFYDPHAPYSPPAPYRERFAGRPYDGEVAFVDDQLARILASIREAGEESRTLVAVVADHGESLGEHDEATHGVLVYQSTMRVPLIVAGPGIPSGRTIAAGAGTVDLLPTLLRLLGIEAPRGLGGRDLSPVMEGRSMSDRPLYGESLFGRLSCRWATLRVLVDGHWKYIEGKAPELYDLSRDPGELHDLATSEPARVEAFGAALGRAVDLLAPGGDTARPNDVTPEQEARLRSLGYVTASPGGGALDDRTLPDPRTHVVYYDRLQAASRARGADLARAFTEVSEITRLDPENPFAHGTLAVMAYQFGDLRVAAASFRRTLELDPDRPGVRQSYGKLLRELGRLDESEQELRLALTQAGPDDAAVSISLADTLLARGRNDEAAALISRTLEREPASVPATGAKGRLLLVRGRARDALPLLQKAAAASTEPEGWIELASASLQAGEVEDAAKAGAEALRRSPGHPWALAVTAHALVLQGQSGRARQLLQRAIDARPRRPGAWISLADAFEAAGDAAAARRCRDQATALSRD